MVMSLERKCSAFILLLVFSSACGSVSPTPQQSDLDIAGVWSGSSTASCAGGFTSVGRCNAIAKITFLLRQDGNQIKGSYGCTYGNMNCRDMNATGKIPAGRISGSQLQGMRVELPDGTSCLFDGVFAPGNGRGGYQCFAGGAVIEQGSWQVARAF
jgi:hypothetical protein